MKFKYEREIAELAGLKFCLKCETPKDKSEFGKHKGSKDGLYPRCKKCEAERINILAKKDPEKVRESNMRFRNKDREHYRALCRKSNQKTRGKK